MPQAFSSSQDQTSNFCCSNTCKQPYSGTSVLTEAHHTNVRLTPRSHSKWDGRFKSDICTVCRRLFAQSGIQHPICALRQVRICFSAKPVLTQAHHTNARLNPRSHYTWDGRLKSDICPVCRRLYAQSGLQHPMCALQQVRISFSGFPVSTEAHHTNGRVNAATTNRMGGLSQTFAWCAAGFLLEMDFDIEFVISNRFLQCFRNACFHRGTPHKCPT